MKRSIFVKTIITAICALFISSLAFAQPREDRRAPGEGPMSPKEMVKELKKQLNLSDEQTTKIENILKAQREEMRKERDQMEDKREAEMEAMREKMEQKRKEIDDKISSVLNAEQKKKFEEIKKERQERFDRPPHR